MGVLTGAGGTFSSGMDLKGFLTGDLPLVEGRGLGGITERWQFFLGLILLGVVLFARGGIIGLFAGRPRHG